MDRSPATQSDFSRPPAGRRETAEVELPDYDTRRLITSRDPLCCVHAFHVMSRVVLPSIYGIRMCPRCPHCAKGEAPCMDSFGSNATAMGGAAGRCDAMVGAVESQSADGVLHVHLFLFVQMAMQFQNLHELAAGLRDKMMTSDALKQYVSHVRCAAYPDVDAHRQARAQVEKRGPRMPMMSASHGCRSSSGLRGRGVVEAVLKCTLAMVYF